jgi:hypothetical protein
MTMRAIVIFGLRRSGTTVLWETLRLDRRILAFDEPFHPRLWAGARQNEKGTWNELGTFWDRERPDVAGATPILPLDELTPEFAPAQVRYFHDLLASHSRVAIDIVRGWNKAGNLLAAHRDVCAIHLLRHPVEWVTAHLLPSGGGTWRKRWADEYRRARFFARRRYFNNWQYEEIIEAALVSRHEIWDYVRLSPTALLSEPAYVKLLAFWWAANLRNHKLLANHACFRTLTLSDFTLDPAQAGSGLYAAAGWSLPEGTGSFGHVNRTRPGWMAQSARWADAAERLGIPSEVVTQPQLSSDLIETAFKRASDPIQA